MSGLKRLIVDIHRRSLWQVLTIYLGASWAVLEVSDQVIDRYLLPEWVYPTAILILMLGLPIVLATAFVREEAPGTTAPAATLAPEADAPAGGAAKPEAPVAAAAESPKPATEHPSAPSGGFLAKHLTLPRAVVAVLVALVSIGLLGASVVLRGEGRVTNASGAAGDAFEERAWLVVAAFEAEEEDEDVALAAREALTVDLQQSQFVNVYSREQMAAVLRRMQLPDTIVVDRRVAVEVAEREGLSAVLTATVRRLGGDYVLSARVIQPSTGHELIAVRSAAREDRLLEGVQALSREVRVRLGEERAAIRRSKPLPQVTTESLDALKLYTQAAEAADRRDSQRALELTLGALELDSTFASAYEAAAIYSRNTGRHGDGADYARRAYELRERLTDKERLEVEATFHNAVEMDYRAAADVYETLLSSYPDDWIAAHNLGVMAYLLGEPERAYQATLRALRLAPYNGPAYGNAIDYARRTDRWDVADSLIQVAKERGFEDGAARWSLDQAIGRRDWQRADQLCDSLLAASSRPSQRAEDRRSCGTLDVVRGRMQRGLEQIIDAADYYGREGRIMNRGATRGLVPFIEAARGRRAATAAFFERILDSAALATAREPTRTIGRTVYLLSAYLFELDDIAARLEANIPPDPETSTRAFAVYAEHHISAARAVRGRRWLEVVDEVRRARSMDYRSDGIEAFADMMLGQAFDELGQPDSAIAFLTESVSPARVADSHYARVRLPAIELRLAELEEKRGDKAAAAAHYQTFIELWSHPDPDLVGRVEAARQALERLASADN